MILSRDKKFLQDTLVKINDFLICKLRLNLHKRKVSIREFHKGVDFLGYVTFPCHTILRTKTKRRIFKKIKNRQLELPKEIINKEKFRQTVQSYLGILKHCYGNEIKKAISKVNKEL